MTTNESETGGSEQTDFLPLELDVEKATIERLGTGEWQVILERDGADDLAIVMDMPDPLYDQLFDAGDLVLTDDGVLSA